MPDHGAMHTRCARYRTKRNGPCHRISPCHCQCAVMRHGPLVALPTYMTRLEARQPGSTSHPGMEERPTQTISYIDHLTPSGLWHRAVLVHAPYAPHHRLDETPTAALAHSHIQFRRLHIRLSERSRCGTRLLAWHVCHAHAAVLARGLARRCALPPRAADHIEITPPRAADRWTGRQGIHRQPALRSARSVILPRQLSHGVAQKGDILLAAFSRHRGDRALCARTQVLDLVCAWPGL